jgi:hypothetical protein
MLAPVLSGVCWVAWVQVYAGQPPERHPARLLERHDQPHQHVRGGAPVGAQFCIHHPPAQCTGGLACGAHVTTAPYPQYGMQYQGYLGYLGNSGT